MESRFESSWEHYGTVLALIRTLTNPHTIMGQALPNTREPIHGAALTIGERQIIERKIERGTSNIRAEADLNKIRVAYTQQGPFTICMVSTPGSLPAMPGLYTPGTLQVAVGRRSATRTTCTIRTWVAAWPSCAP